VNTRRASRRQVGQDARLLASAMGRASSNEPHSWQAKTYTGMPGPQLVLAAEPRSADTGPSVDGLISKSKISVGR